MNTSFLRKFRGFTLIELLIVIAIILILISIALPNFLEAQLRARVVRARGEMRGLGQATSAYFNDYKTDPSVDNLAIPDVPGEPNRSRTWWGFASHRLTTPVAYTKKIPTDIFPDANKILLHGWTSGQPKNGVWNAPYLVIVRVNTKEKPVRELWHFRPFGISACPNVGGMDPQTWQALGTAPWVYYTAGPDMEATLAWLGVGGKTFASYNPTNGTQSKGDIWTGGY